MSSPTQVEYALEAYVRANRKIWMAPSLASDREIVARQHVYDCLHYSLNKGKIERFKINEVSYSNGQFTDVSVSRNALPGHPYVVNGVYVGVIVAVRTEKRKRIATVMMTNPMQNGVLKISVAVQLSIPAEFVQIELKV